MLTAEVQQIPTLWKQEPIKPGRFLSFADCSFSGKFKWLSGSSQKFKHLIAKHVLAFLKMHFVTALYMFRSQLETDNSTFENEEHNLKHSMCGIFT